MWLASSVGLAVLGTLAASKTSSLVARGQSQASALVAGYHITFLIGSILAALGLVVTLLVLRGPARGVVDAQSVPAQDSEVDHSELLAVDF